MKQRTTRARTLMTVAIVGALTACGADASTEEADVTGQVPTPDVTAFTGGDFDDIELPAGADEASEKTERDGVVSQSYFATAQSPQQIMDFFSNSLALQGWDVVEPVSERGTDSLAAAWATDDGRRLEVSALLAQGVEDERTQFSVVLLPSSEPGEEITGG